MKGLLYKDFIQNKLNVLLLIIATPVVLFISSIENTFFLVPLFFYISSIIIIQSNIIEDEKCKFNSFIYTSPITIKQNVFSKYVLIILVALLSVVVNVLMLGIEGFSLERDIATLIIVGTFSFIIIMNSLSIPVIHAFGIQVGQFVNMILYIGIIFVIPKLFKNIDIFSFFKGKPIYMISLSTIIVSIIFLITSYKITLIIASKKDY